jgi:hypothetical protein
MPDSSKGCCIFAFNTDEVDYIGHAVLAADRVNRYLDMPVTIISNQEIRGGHGNIVIDAPVRNIKLRKQWFNLARTQALELTPYDRTLVLDSDYMLFSDTLQAHVDSTVDFIMTKQLYDPTTGNLTVNQLGKSHLPVYWATVMIFNKGIQARQIFATAQLVQKHYAYYAALYGFVDTPIRNDFIFSIACHIAGGYGQTDYGFVNYPLVNCDSRVEYVELRPDGLVYDYIKGERYRNRITNMDLHLMNKDST